MERSKRERSGGRNGGRVEPKAPARGRVCCGLSALTGQSSASVHLCCPLGQFPWKPSVFLIFEHIYCARRSHGDRSPTDGLNGKLLELLLLVLASHVEPQREKRCAWGRGRAVLKVRVRLMRQVRAAAQLCNLAAVQPRLQH